MMEQESLSQPFGPVVEEQGFYQEPQRVECLNFLLHLAPYSDGLLFVSGESGSGKSTVLRQFIAKAADNWRVCALEAEQLENLPVFLREIQQFYGFSLHGANDQPAQIEKIFEHLGVLQRKGLRPLLIIDDAHRLVAEIVHFLDALMEMIVTDKGRLGLILLAEEQLTSQAWFASFKRFGLHSFSLAPLSFEETARYIAHHLQVGGYAPEAVSPSQIKKIYKLAHGNLKYTNQFALAFLKPEQAQQAANFEGRLIMDQETTATKKPIKFSRILFAMLSVLLGLALYFEDEINSYFAPKQQVVVQPTVHKLDVSPKELEQRTSPPQIALPQVAEEQTTPPEASVAPKPMQEQQPMQPAVVAPPVVVEQKPAEVKATAPVSEPTKLEVKPIAETKAVTQQEVVKVPEPTAKSEARAEPTAKGGVKRESWIMEQNPGHYILQIMAFSQESGVTKTLAKIPAKDMFAYYKFKKDGQIWYRLAYGIYPDRKTADAAIAGLPKELGKVNPWVRRIGEVQKEITP